MRNLDGTSILYRSKHRGKINIQYIMNLINIQLGIKAWSNQTYIDFLDICHCYPERILPARMIPELIFIRDRNNTTVSIHMTNIFDTDYELIQDFPMPGRSWQFTLTKTLN